MHLQRWWWSCVGEELSDFVHGGVLASFQLDSARESSTSLRHPTAKFEGHRAISSPIDPSKVDLLDHLKVHALRGVEEDRLGGRARGAGP